MIVPLLGILIIWTVKMGAEPFDYFTASVVILWIFVETIVNRKPSINRVHKNGTSKKV